MIVISDRAQHPALPHSAGPDPDGRLAIGGCSLVDLAITYGTPLFAVDVEELRMTARAYLRELRSRHGRSDVYFALKAFPCAPVMRVLADEGLGCEVVSAGELAIALSAGVDPARIVLHGNAKTDEDLQAALEAGVGIVVIDSLDDVERLGRLATGPQRVLVRVNPDIAATTHAAFDTGSGTSKFGVALANVPEVIERIARTDALRIEGLHVHAGSQLLDMKIFERAAAALAPFGRFDTYDLGGGLGVAYAPGDEEPTIGAYADALVGALSEYLNPSARLIIEPGRSIVARSCVTLYSVVTVKRAERTHVAVDGGMGDNLEVALYDTRFAPFVVDKEEAPERCELVGRHCEAGDVLARDVELASPAVGDIVAVPGTGAYCYALMNNYNGALRPPVVLCGNGSAELVVRRETIDDLLARDRSGDPIGL